jgi:hypothetical protein
MNADEKAADDADDADEKAADDVSRNRVFRTAKSVDTKTRKNENTKKKP